MLKVKEMPKNMSEFAVDCKNLNGVFLSGAFEEYIEIDGNKRSFITYIPENMQNCNPCIVVAVPGDQRPVDFLETSGFKAFADDNKLFIHLLGPEAGGWKMSGEDADCMNAVYVKIQARDYYVTMQDNIYACGAGDGANIAQQAAKKMASEWSGLFTYGDLMVDIQADQTGFAKEQDQGDGELKVQAQKSQLPVWMMISAQNEWNDKAIDYWKEENHVMEESLSGQGADYIWMPNPVRDSSEVNEEKIAQVRVTISSESVSYSNIDMIWKYIKMARRHRGRAKKNLRYYKDPIECGATLQEITVDGMKRIWYEYVPETCTPDKEWPLVVVMHGRGGSAESFFDITGMSNVAKERQFIAVFPQASVHQQKKDGLNNVLLWCGSCNDEPINDITFIRSMVTDIQDRLRIDKGRIYACGQSSGGMMTDVLCECASDLFAACAAWSALESPSRMYRRFDKTQPLTPTMFIFGDSDWLSAGREPDPDFPVSLEAEMKQQILEKFERYHLDRNRVQIWENNPITWYCFPNDEGVPMLTIGCVDHMVHANYPEESWISYDQFFCQFSRDAQGDLCYRGSKVK